MNTQLMLDINQRLGVVEMQITVVSQLLAALVKNSGVAPEVIAHLTSQRDRSVGTGMPPAAWNPLLRMLGANEPDGEDSNDTPF